MKHTNIHYAKNTHEQINLNAADADYRKHWEKFNLSSASDPELKPKGSARSFYQHSLRQLLGVPTSEVVESIGEPQLEVLGEQPSKDVLQGKPWTFTAHDFDIDIPNCAYIQKSYSYNLVVINIIS